MSESITPKRASWLELFYDLAFVALVAQLTYLVADNHSSVTDWLNAFIIGYTIFIAWTTTTANRNLQDSESPTDKLIVQIQMVGAFLMSITMPAVFVGSYFGYFAAFAIIRLIQVGTVLRLYRLRPEHAPQTNNMVQGMTVAAGLWCVSGFTPDPYHFVMAGMALATDILTPMTRGRGNRVRMLNVHHLQERMGLFLLLVLGESMLVVALANTVTEVDVAQPLIVMSGVVLIIALWWSYFFHLERWDEGIRPKNIYIYMHAHGWMYGSIILLAAGYKNMLKHGTPKIEDMVLYFLGLLGIALMLTSIRATLHGVKSYFLKIFLFIAATHTVLFGALLAGYLSGLQTLLMSVAIICLAAAYDTKLMIKKSHQK